MLRKLKYKNITWIDLTNPTQEEVLGLAEQYGIHSLVANELTTPSHRSKVDTYDEHMFLVLHFPHCQICQQPLSERPDGHSTEQELDFIIGKDFLITTHYEPIAPVDEFAQIFEANLSFHTQKEKPHAGILFFAIVRQLYHGLEENMQMINYQLKRAENNIFAGQEKEMVSVLSMINRDLLDFRWALKSHQEILNSLENASLELFGDKFAYYLRALEGKFDKIWHMLESNHETFEDLRQTNDSLLTIKTNEVMKIIAILAFVTFPLTLLTSIFGMNTEYLPIVGLPYDFWIIVAIMLIGVSIMFWFFRRKKWL